MPNATYTGLETPNDVLTAMRDFFVDNGWTILQDLVDDLVVDGSSATYDGKILAVLQSGVILVFRSANGRNIFPNQLNVTAGADDSRAWGIGLTSCTDYTATPPSGLWYDQPNAIKDTSEEVIGCGIPVRMLNLVTGMTLYCNYVTEPAVSVTFSLDLGNKCFVHLSGGAVEKVGSWTGGTIVSGSFSSYDMFPSNWSKDFIDQQSHILYGMNQIPSTFVRANIDSAPTDNPPCLWAAAGPQTGTCCTGKILASSILHHDYLASMPKVPHYGYLQSQTTYDFGRNVNTLNCISVDLPIILYAQRDPNVKMNFSQIGYVSGVYAISMRNVAPAKMYEISYPQSGNLHQVFPHCVRAGYHGYDGISITQEEAPEETP